MKHLALSLVCLVLLGGCVTRERVVVVEGPAPGYQGYYRSSGEAAYLAHARTSTYIPPPDLGPRPPVIYYTPPPVLYSPPPQVVYSYPTVYPTYGAFGPSPYYPRSTYVYRSYSSGWGWGNSWSGSYPRYHSTPHYGGHHYHSAPVHHGHGHGHSHGHSFGSHHHH